MTQKQRRAINETYEQVRRMVEAIARKYIATFHLNNYEQTELWSRVGEIYVHCSTTFDFTRSVQFVSFVRTQMERKLYDFITETLRRRERHPSFSSFDFEINGVHLDTRYMLDLESEVSEDAYKIACLFLNPPTVLSKRLHRRAESVSQKAILVMKEYLSDIGWASQRVTYAFQELEVHLSRDLSSGASTNYFPGQHGNFQTPCKTNE